MTYQEATIKAVKLLRLAQSSNENEAALAMTRAQELIDRHKLTGLSLDMDTENPPEDIIHFTHDPLDPEAHATWKHRLAISLCYHNQCRVYRSSGKLIIVGRPSDATTVRYLYGWMTREIDRLAAAKCAGCGRTYWNSFRIGAANCVSDRLAEQRDATIASVKVEAELQGSTMALVRVNNAIAKMDARLDEVNTWTKRNLKLRTVTRQSRINSTAREMGYAAGKTISLRPAAGSLINSTKRLQA